MASVFERTNNRKSSFKPEVLTKFELLKTLMNHMLLRRLLTVLVIIGLLIVALQFGVEYFSRHVISDLVAKQTKGKVQVEIGRVRLHLFPNEALELHNTSLIFLDDQGKEKKFSVRFRYLSLQLQSIRAFFRDRTLLVDYLIADQPSVDIHPKAKGIDESGNHDMSFKIGNIYIEMQKVISSMRVKRFGLRNGHLTLHELEPNKKTIRIGGIDIRLDELALNKKEDSQNPELSLEQLKIRSGAQDIEFPEGDYRIQYAFLEFDTEANIVQINQFKLNSISNDSAKNELAVDFDHLRLRNINFSNLYLYNKFEADSVVCTNPNLNLSLRLAAKKEQQVTGIDFERRIAALIGNIKLNYIGLTNSNITLRTIGKTIDTFVTKGNNFYAYNINIDSANAMPIDVGRLQFAIKNYSETLNNGLYNVYFDSVVYNNKSLALINFRLLPTKKNKQANRQNYIIPVFRLDDLEVHELLLNRYLKAQQLTLANPIFINNYTRQKVSTQKARSIKEILREFSDIIDLETIQIINGRIQNKAVNADEEIIATGIESEISVNEMLDLSTYETMVGSIEKMKFDSATFRSNKQIISLRQGEFYGKEKKILAAQFTFNNNQNRIAAKNITINNYSFNDELNRFSVGNFQAGATSINYTTPKKVHVETDLQSIVANTLRVYIDEEISMKYLDVTGNFLRLQSPELNLSINTFEIEENTPSYFNDLQIEQHTASTSLKASVPRVAFVPNLQASIDKEYPILQELVLNNPTIALTTSAPEVKKDKGGSLEIGKLIIERAKLNLLQRNGHKSLAVQSAALDFSAQSLAANIGNHVFTMKNSRLHAPDLDLNVNDSIQLKVDNNRFSIAIDHLDQTTDPSPRNFSTSISDITAQSVTLTVMPKSGQSFRIYDFNVGGQHINIDSANPAHVLRQLKANPTLYANNIDLEEETDKYSLYANGIGYRNGGRIITVDSFRYIPKTDREAFMRNQKFQKDFMAFRTGKITVHNFDIERIATDSALKVDRIVIDQPELDVYKDKRLPIEADIIKPLPVDLLKKINTRIRIDSLLLQNGIIRYDEFSDKTETVAAIRLTQLQGSIRNIDNYGLTANDSLYLLMTARLQDATNLSIRFHESYSDSLSSFLYRVRFSQFDLPALNEILLPIANMRIRSGRLDTLELRAMGSDILAHGKMRMYYSNLKIDFINKKDWEQNFFNKTLSWLANTFLRTNNVKKTGSVFTERLREKSFANYWTKIVLSGAMTNTRIKRNSKQEKRYQRTLKRIKIPELPEVNL
ncbi:MAG: DUF748 domain-containing protein [Bacteroidota bacterium]